MYAQPMYEHGLENTRRGHRRKKGSMMARILLVSTSRTSTRSTGGVLAHLQHVHQPTFTPQAVGE